MLAQKSLLKPRSTVDSMLTCMDNFYQGLISTSSPSKDACLLVYSCIRYFLKEIRKVGPPTMKAANMTDSLDRVGSYLWAMAQAHRVANEFTKHQWREHPAMSGQLIIIIFVSLLPHLIVNCFKMR